MTGINDATFEGNESITVDVTNVINGTENGTQAVTATIIDIVGWAASALAIYTFYARTMIPLRVAAIAGCARKVKIYKDNRYSDHAPLTIDYDL